MAWYVVYLCLGILVGITAFIIGQIEEYFTEWRILATEEYKDNIGLGWVIYCLFGVLYVGLAATFTAYLAPGAAGSGTAEMMGYLNGVRYPSFLGV